MSLVAKKIKEKLDFFKKIFCTTKYVIWGRMFSREEHEEYVIPKLK